MTYKSVLGNGKLSPYQSWLYDYGVTVGALGAVTAFLAGVLIVTL